ncbi:MAG: N-formylglutamate deformylase [Betaproteobacteria bacterium]|nr:N-formylglutamate deformylase [Betaproteobacteria bacterium]
MPEAVFELRVATAPLLISVPHAGRELPAELAPRLTADGLAQPDTDWHVPTLYAFAASLGAGLLVARYSRYVIDLNRDPEGAALYPGADNTELCPSGSFALQALYRQGAAPDAAEVRRRREVFFDPYHQALASELDRLRARHGHALLLDAHSIRSVVPRFFSGRLPDLNLGSAGGKSAAPELEREAYAVLSQAVGFTAVLNGRFQGGFITRHYGRPEDHIHALQLEIAQAAYLDEQAPAIFAAERAAALGTVLRALVSRLIAWREH